MFQLISSILQEFLVCFKRLKTWRWFVTIVMGFMLRNDQRGVTSVISSLKLKPELYHTMLHFFRSSGYTVKDLYAKWIKIAMKYASVERIAGRVVLLGDHSKISKEGLRMPNVQILHQESENSGKSTFISGHNFGQVSAVITNGKVSRSLPLMTEMQESPPKKEGSKKPDGNTLVTQMISLVHETAKFINQPVIVALDAYFSSKSAWIATDKTIMPTGERQVEIITRAQSNTVAYTIPKIPKFKKRGQPRKYGNKIVLYNLFSDMSKFKQTTMALYGKQAKVKYLCIDLIWRPVKRLVRFVLVESSSGKCILMSTSSTLTPEEMIYIYALRFKIETSFAEQKNDMGSFSYHFWTKYMPKRKKWKKAEPASDEKLQKKMASAKNAMESFVCLCTIATGILSIIAFSHNCEIWNRYPGWIRTLRSDIPTIATVKATLSQDFHAFLRLYPHVILSGVINRNRRNIEFFYNSVT